jgi:glycosyltransferase involved in cell wall biosynthesis
VLLCVHHRLDPDAGAPGATLELGRALSAAGCEVDYFAYDHAFREISREAVGHQLRFPWKVATFLTRQGSRFDVIDASSGDAWVWASLGRPRARRRNALVTRSHGLEHVSDECARRSTWGDGEPLSWKYPLYHGGFRLWEVQRSLRAADHCVLLNSGDCAYAGDRLGVRVDRMSVMANGIRDHFHAAPDVEGADGGPVRLAFIGNWISRKGRDVLPEAIRTLADRGLDFRLSILGAGRSSGVLDDFAGELHDRLSLQPTFANEDLPELLAGQEVLLFPSLAEGSSVAMLEGMACGLAPVATEVGAAPDVIEPGRQGLLIPPGDPDALAEAVLALAGDRSALTSMRRHAQETARGYRWDTIAAKTIELYQWILRR